MSNSELALERTMLTENDLAPLRGLTVAEVSHSPAAALAGLILADFGATVYSLDRGDHTCARCLVPDYADVMYAGGKERLTATPDTVFDVVLEDAALCVHGPSSLPEWLRYRTAVRITPFTTPSDGSAARRGSPFTAESAGGVSIALGEAGESPLRLPTGVAESIAGLNATAALLSVVYGEKGRTLGHHDIEVSVASSLEYLVGMNNKMFEGYPRTWHREGRRSAGSSGPYPLAIFDAADGLIGLVGRSPKDWACILDAMGNPAWADRVGYRDPFHVAQHHADEVDTYVSAWTKGLTIAEIVEKSHEHGFVAAPVSSMAEAMSEPQLDARGLWLREKDDAVTGMKLPFRSFGASSAESRTAGAKTGDTARRPLLAQPSRLLSDVRVLDFTWVWSGPMATGILAALGAEVIKVEHPDRMDGARLRGRPNEPDGTPRPGPEGEVTPYFHQNGAGKFSFEASMKEAAAVQDLLSLASDCDVVIENMRPGVLERNGMGYQAIRDRNDEIVMLSMSVAGQTGPLAKTRGYATVMSGLAGFESQIGYGPERVTGGYTFAIADPVAGLFGAISVIASLIARDRGGEGRYLDMSQLEAILNTLRIPVAQELSGRGARAEGLTDDRLAAQYACRAQGDDNWVAMSFGSRESIDAFLRQVDERLAASGPTDRASGDRAWDAVDAWAIGVSSEAVVDAVEASGGVAAPVIPWADDARRREYLGPEASVELDHPFGGRERIFVPPWQIDGARPAFARRAPLLGEHTDEILRSAGIQRPGPDVAE